jgi:hypothetical protein
VQILNISAGQTDQECKAAEERQKIDLLAEGQSDANFFFVAAVLAVLGTGLLPLRINFLVNVGLIDLLRLYGRGLGQRYADTVHGASLAWVLVLVTLGFSARDGRRWAFLCGIALYAADMLALVATFSIWAFGIHAFFVYKWFEGRRN